MICISFLFSARYTVLMCIWKIPLKYESHLSWRSFKSISTGFRLDLNSVRFFFHSFHWKIKSKAFGIRFSHQNGIYPRNMIILCISNPMQFNCVYFWIDVFQPTTWAHTDKFKSSGFKLQAYIIYNSNYIHGNIYSSFGMFKIHFSWIGMWKVQLKH